jgi:hypothetical protein
VPDRRGGVALRGLLGAIVLMGLVAGALLVILSRGEEGAERVAAPSSLDVPVPDATESPLTADAAPGPVGSSLLEAEPEDREPTDADGAAFATAYDPPEGEGVELLAADLAGDGRPEVVAAFVAGGFARIEVAAWDGMAYQVVFTDQGGPADELITFEVRDVTGDGNREIVTEQATDDRESLAMWGTTEEGVVRLVVRGGCWDGSHVVGEEGAEVGGGELTATCAPREDEDGRVARGGRDVYTWDGEAWTHEPTEDG